MSIATLPEMFVALGDRQKRQVDTEGSLFSAQQVVFMAPRALGRRDEARGEHDVQVRDQI